MQLGHTHTLDWDAERQRDDDSAAHAHRDDLTPAMVFEDPLFTRDPEGNPFFVDLCRAYKDERVVRCLWETAFDTQGRLTP